MADEQANPAGAPIPGAPVPDAPGPAAEASEPPGAEQAAQPRTVIDAAADLLQMIVDFLRQEVATIVREKVALPLQMVGLTAAWASAAASCLVIGLAFIAVALLMLLASVVGWPGALLIVGGAFVLGSIIFTLLKVRSMQK